MFSKYQHSTCYSDPHKMLLVDMGYSHFIEKNIGMQKDEMPFTRTCRSGLEGQGLRSSIWISNLNSLTSTTGTRCDEQTQTLSELPLPFIFAYRSVDNMESSAHLDKDPLMEDTVIPGSLVGCWVGWSRLIWEGVICPTWPQGLQHVNPALFPEDGRSPWSRA